MEQRIISECGSRQVKSRYLSSQNAALVQYRVPRLGQGFSLRVHYVKNPQRKKQYLNNRILRPKAIDFRFAYQIDSRYVTH